MTFEEVASAAAKQAERAVSITLQQMKAGHVYDEDDVTGFLVGSLATLFDKHQIGDVTLSAAILRHRRGTAAEERRYGADILIHVSMDTPTQEYSKGVLIQAKKKELTDYWSPTSHDELVEQCNRMLRVTAAAFVFSYTEGGIRCGAATRVAGAKVVTNPGIFVVGHRTVSFLSFFGARLAILGSPAQTWTSFRCLSCYRSACLEI